MAFSVPVPWRSVWLPRVAAAVALLTGLPLFLRSPLWCDITLYDLAARNLLSGGMHYRDIFDTNLPGFVWLLTGIRWVFGPEAIVVRLADLLIVSLIVVLLDRLAKWGGATLSSRWWALAGIAFLYPFSVEMVHAQRDTWMALPAIAAVVSRIRRTRAADTLADASTPTAIRTAASSPFNTSFLEGVLWGCAVWIKPHIILMAGAVWLVTAVRTAGNDPRWWRSLALDLAGNLAGGLLIGAAGMTWMVLSGTWVPFWDVVTVWNPEYTKLAGSEFDMRMDQELHWFPPWSLLVIPTVPLALLSIIDAAPWRAEPRKKVGAGPVGRILPGWLWDRTAGPDARYVRCVVATLYLMWAAQAFVIQRGFVYAHLTETLLMITLWASHRFAMPVLPLLWTAATSVVWLIGDATPSLRQELLTIAIDRHGSADEERFLIRHPLADPNRMRWWGECWNCNQSTEERYEMWDGLRRLRDHEAAIDWAQLEEVAEYLRQKNVRDGEVIGWHDTPHVVYLMLHIKPGIRFMHICTAQGIGEFGSRQVQLELAAAAGKARYAVGDLEWAALGSKGESRQQLLGPPCNQSDLLPCALTPGMRASFPFNQRAVFRTRGGLGRYTVHELTPPFQP
jgi:hypothetical protein